MVWLGGHALTIPTSCVQTGPDVNRTAGQAKQILITRIREMSVTEGAELQWCTAAQMCSTAGCTSGSLRLTVAALRVTEQSGAGEHPGSPAGNVQKIIQEGKCLPAAQVLAEVNESLGV